VLTVVRAGRLSYSQSLPSSLPTAPAPLLSLAAIAAGVPVVEINLDPSPISGAVTLYLHGRASETLPQLVDLVLLP
jgi:NAD-dependent SIR2 family protein deacetylase